LHATGWSAAELPSAKASRARTYAIGKMKLLTQDGIEDAIALLADIFNKGIISPSETTPWLCKIEINYPE